MDWTIYVSIAAALVLVLAIICITVIMRSKKKPDINVEAVYDALGQRNIKSITLRRNKINATLLDHKAADMVALKSAGAAGVNVVGNTAKFYFDADTEDVYEGLKQKIDKRG